MHMAHHNGKALICPRYTFFMQPPTSKGESLAKVNIKSYICKKLMILKAMIDKNVSLDLMAFIETDILPRYAAFDKAHNLTHVTRVINRSIKLAQKSGRR